MASDTVKMINKGMITIPAKIRKDLNLKNGSEFFVVVNEYGTIELIPYIEDIHESDKWTLPYTSEEIMEKLQKSKEVLLDVENKNYEHLHKQIFEHETKNKENTQQ